MSNHSKEEEHAGMLAAGNNSSISKKRKKTLFAVFASLLIVASIIGLAAGVASSKHQKVSNQHTKIELQTAHLIVKSSCESTLYPDLCYSSLADELKTSKTRSKKVKNQKDVIQIALNITIKNVQQNQAVVEKILNKNHNKLSKRVKLALQDCLETIDESLDELHKAVEDLEVYPNKKSLREHADDLKTLLSAAMTNPETCIDGFSHDEAAKKVREELLNGQEHVEKMCSNSLAMICNMTNTDLANEEMLMKGRNLKEEEEENHGWPEWLSAGDRRLLQSTTVTPNVVVAADGSGNFKTISEAVNKAPTKSSKRYIIRIKSGVYRENVEVPMTKTNIMFVGDGKTSTIVTGSKNVVDGATTFSSATVAVVGERFLARDITFQNTAGPSKHQAVALRVGSDLSAFYRCDILGYQDSLFVHSNRQFFVNCLIAGTVDFIFGNAAVVLQNCDIHARRPNSGQKNMVTAQGRTDPNQNTGIVIQKSRIAATSDLRPVQKSFPTYLGRPWKAYSRTVIMQSTISDVVSPAGWHEWSGSFGLNTLFYGEYANSGAGARTTGRVKWKGVKVITSATEAQAYSPGRFIAAATWLGSTGFPFSTGL